MRVSFGIVAAARPQIAPNARRDFNAVALRLPLRPPAYRHITTIIPYFSQNFLFWKCVINLGKFSEDSGEIEEGPSAQYEERKNFKGKPDVSFIHATCVA